MILTTNKHFEGFQKLTKHFNVEPEVALKGLDLASSFCSAQLCSTCMETACVDCKDRQPSEYKNNSDGLNVEPVQKEPIKVWEIAKPQKSEKAKFHLSKDEKLFCIL